MREILFKAKRKGTGKWEEGYYEKKIEWHRLSEGEYVKTEKHYICVNMVSSEDSYIDRIEVIPETICQYTGLQDKNGRKIWEKDIVTVDVDRAIAMYSEKYSGYILQPIGDYYFDSPMLADNVDIIDNIIGNVFDNPELLKGGE